eukprot:CAMPEP_0174824102 /NCGR_PEP_ID=MMETSP1107-20130205/30643_1 /TAXON_ID=36770 /ORGANISM="Paraphysomonas vestita, Strain GFlagA" /LENGTH=304 /DNA_ID=CAMNT_0016049589 /DNA_START=457 /DNA_END=1371 /DNA_ORIENTATION=-
MEEDTLMNRALSGHNAMKESTTQNTSNSSSSTSSNNTKTRRVQRRPRTKTQSTNSNNSNNNNTNNNNNNNSNILSNEKSTDINSDDSDNDQNIERDGSDYNRFSNSNNSNNDLPSPSPLPPPPIQPETQLPEGWAQVTTEDGRIYYYHKITRVSRWDLPSQEETNRINEQINQTQQKMVECRIRPDECDLENDEDHIKIKVATIIRNWTQPSNMNRTRSIPELLTTIPTIIDTSIVPEGSIFKEPLTLSTPPNEVKKAYLRAVRLVHPDKLVSLDLNFEKKLLAQEIFITISEKYDLYRKAHGI